MRPTRIIAVGIPRVLSDIIATNLDSDMELVATAPDRTGLLRLVEESGADVVIMGVDVAEVPDESTRLFDAHPHLKVLGVVGRGSMIYLYEFWPSRSVLGELSAAELVAAIRRATRRGSHPSS